MLISFKNLRKLEKVLSPLLERRRLFLIKGWISISILFGPGDFGRFVMFAQAVEILIKLFHPFFVTDAGFLSDSFDVSFFLLFQKSNFSFGLFGKILWRFAAIQIWTWTCFGRFSNGFFQIFFLVLGLFLLPENSVSNV